MPKSDTQMVATAGEHFVAFRLAQLGFVVAMPRLNSPAVDLMASSFDGSKMVTIQVKTASWAERTRGRGKDKRLDHVEFPLGHKAASRSDPNYFYAFVDLRGMNTHTTPTVYIVPSEHIKQYCGDWTSKYSMIRWHPKTEEVDQFKEEWGLIVDALR
ncbi:MAG: hypothetical protein M5R41_06340 [Bacteroidia bacterium]|nr:hypothetical protein [Bacteroidia bacterium]